MRLIDADELIKHFEEIANDRTLPFETQAYALGAINDVKSQPTVDAYTREQVDWILKQLGVEDE